MIKKIKTNKPSMFSTQTEYIFNYGLHVTYAPFFYKVGFDMLDGSFKTAIVTYYKKHNLGEWFVNLKKALNKFYNNNVTRIAWVTLIDTKNKANNSQSFAFYKRINSKIVFHHSYTYKLGIEETPEMALYTLSRLYPNFYIKSVSKKQETNMEQRIKELIPKLKKQSNAKMIDCKNAITDIFNKDATLNDKELLSEALNILNEKKQIIALKRIDNETNHFVLEYYQNETNCYNMFVKFGCESEQGALKLKKDYNDRLKKITNILGDEAIEWLFYANNANYDETNSIEDVLSTISGELNEKVAIIAIERAESPIPNTDKLQYASYNHQDKKGGLLIYNTKEETNQDIIRLIINQLVFTNPLAVKKEELSNSIVDLQKKEYFSEIIKSNERYNILSAMKIDGNASEEDIVELSKLKSIPEKQIENVIKGKINKFKKEMCFETQDFIFGEEGAKTLTINELCKQKGITIIDAVTI